MVKFNVRPIAFITPRHSEHFALKSFDGGPYHIETSPLIWRANQWTGFYVIETKN